MNGDRANINMYVDANHHVSEMTGANIEIICLVVNSLLSMRTNTTVIPIE